jgi:EPS-associated MarR family transcriptional regulator
MYPRAKAILMEEFHYKLLKVLQDNPDLSQRELAREVGLSLGKTNYCLRALIEKGFIKASNFRNSQNKVAYAYLLTPRGIEEKIQATADFLKRKVVEYRALEKEIEQLRSEVKQGQSEANVLPEGRV